MAVEELSKNSLRPSTKIDPAVVSEIKLYGDLISKFGNQKEHEGIQEALKDDNRRKLLELVYSYSKLYANYIFIQCTFYFCAVISIRHSNIARYPEDDINPLNFYQRKNPSVSFQPLLLII